MSMVTRIKNTKPTMGDDVATVRPRGRPQIRTDDEILAAALEAFASLGFEATSIRNLNKDLGLSHEAVRQRFGSKDQLYWAAVDHAIAKFHEELATEATAKGGDLEALRESLRAFIVTTRRHQNLGRLLVSESLYRSERMDELFARVLEPGLVRTKALLDRLVEAGAIWPISLREYFFLAEGAAAPFARVALSEAFEPVVGPLDSETYVATVVDILMRGITRPSV